MINWFNIPDEGLSNGGLFEVKELEVTENGTYEEKGEMYNKVTVNVEGGGGSSDFSTATVTLISTKEFVDISIPIIINDGISALSSPDVGTFTVPLYKNKAILNVLNLYSISISGDAVYNDGGLPTIIVSGDCSITFTPRD